jgi:type I restriction enzyme M protein
MGCTDAPDLDGVDPRVKVFDNTAFGFQHVTVEQPMNHQWVISPESLAALGESKVLLKHDPDGDPPTVFVGLLGSSFVALARGGDVTPR